MKTAADAGATDALAQPELLPTHLFLRWVWESPEAAADAALASAPPERRLHFVLERFWEAEAVVAASGAAPRPPVAVLASPAALRRLLDGAAAAVSALTRAATPLHPSHVNSFDVVLADVLAVLVHIARSYSAGPDGGVEGGGGAQLRYGGAPALVPAAGGMVRAAVAPFPVVSSSSSASSAATAAAVAALVPLPLVAAAAVLSPAVTTDPKRYWQLASDGGAAVDAAAAAAALEDAFRRSVRAEAGRCLVALDPLLLLRLHGGGGGGSGGGGCGGGGCGGGGGGGAGPGGDDRRFPFPFLTPTGVAPK